MKLGFVRPTRQHSVQVQRKALIEAGVAEVKIYDMTKGDSREDCFKGIRPGDELVLYKFGVIANGRKDFAMAIATLNEKRPWTVIEAATGRKATVKDDIAVMLSEAMNDWAGERFNLSVEQLQQAGRKGAGKRWLGRKLMPVKEAMAIWRDVARYPTAEEALACMPGWGRRKAYMPVSEGGLGPRGAPAGAPKRDVHKKFVPPDLKVYFMLSEDGKAVKIGIAEDVEKRLTSMATGNHNTIKILAIVKGGYAEERALHRKFIDFKIRGEWFRYEGKLKTYVERLTPYRPLRRKSK